MGDPEGVGDIWPGSAKLGNKEEIGRHWRDKALRWAPLEYKGKDGYTSVASRMLAQLDLEEDEELSWGGLCPRVQVDELDLELGSTDNRDWWEYRLQDEDLIQGRKLVYSDGSKLEDGKVGGGWYGEQQMGSTRVGDTVTVWDGEIAGMLGATETFQTGEQI